MRIKIFCHSLVSDWNHGNAHFLRGVASELIARGHAVQTFEPNNNWSLTNLLADRGAPAVRQFQERYPMLKSTFYEPEDDRLGGCGRRSGSRAGSRVERPRACQPDRPATGEKRGVQAALSRYAPSLRFSSGRDGGLRTERLRWRARVWRGYSARVSGERLDPPRVGFGTRQPIPEFSIRCRRWKRRATLSGSATGGTTSVPRSFTNFS